MTPDTAGPARVDADQGGAHRPDRGRPDVATRTVRRLEMQGFRCASTPALPEVEPWLRLSPGLTAALAAVGTALAAPAFLVALALLTGVCAATPRHPFDHLYNRGIRTVTGTPMLPRNRAPRRFACGLATAWLVVTGVVFWSGATAVGYGLGAVLVFLGGIAATTHWCFGSFVYHTVVRRAVGRRVRP